MAIPGIATATMTGAPAGTATATKLANPVPTPWNKDKSILWLNGPGGNVKIPVKGDCSKCGSNHDGITDSQMQRVTAAVNCANEEARKLDAAAKHVQVNFSSSTISYIGFDGERHDISQRKINDPQLLALINEIQELSKNFARFRNSEESEVIANRPSDGISPLEKTTRLWGDFSITLSASQYLEKHHSQLHTYLNSKGMMALANESVANIYAADKLITHMQTELQTKRDTVQTDLNALIPPASLEKRRQLREKLKLLDKQIEQFQKLDRHAIFHSVSFGGNLATNPAGGLTLKDQYEKGEHSRNSMASFLTSSRGRNNNYIFTGKIGAPSNLDIGNYSDDVKDILVHHRWHYEEKRKDGEKILKRHSAEEFIVYNILRLTDPGLNRIPALPAAAGRLPAEEQEIDSVVSSLATHVDIRSEMFEVIHAARAATLAEYTAIHAHTQPLAGDFMAQKQLAFP